MAPVRLRSLGWACVSFGHRLAVALHGALARGRYVLARLCKAALGQLRDKLRGGLSPESLEVHFFDRVAGTRALPAVAVDLLVLATEMPTDFVSLEDLPAVEALNVK